METSASHQKNIYFKESIICMENWVGTLTRCNLCIYANIIYWGKPDFIYGYRQSHSIGENDEKIGGVTVTHSLSPPCHIMSH